MGIRPGAARSGGAVESAAVNALSRGAAHAARVRAGYCRVCPGDANQGVVSAADGTGGEGLGLRALDCQWNACRRGVVRKFSGLGGNSLCVGAKARSGDGRRLSQRLAGARRGSGGDRSGGLGAVCILATWVVDWGAAVWINGYGATPSAGWEPGTADGRFRTGRHPRPRCGAARRSIPAPGARTGWQFPRTAAAS